MSSGVINRFFACGQLLLGWLVFPGAAHAAAEPERVVLQLPYTHQFQFAGVYAAISQGYFKEAGLDVEMRTGTLERRPTVEVQEGRAQYGIGASFVLHDRLNGSPFVALAVIFQHSPFVMVVRSDSKISTPADLTGKRIAMSSLLRYTELKAMFHVEGLKPEQFTVVPDQWNHNELLTGEADAISAFVTDMPYEAAQQGVDFKFIRPMDYGVDFYGDFLFTSENETRDHPERALGMQRALVRGWDYALAHPEEMIEWILTRLPEKDRSAGRTREWLRYEAGATAHLINSDLVEIGHMNPGRWQRMAELMVGIGQAKSTDRMQGFIFAPDRASFPGWVRWLFGILGLAVLVALAALLANRRLQLLVRRRTQELQLSEQRQRDYFELAPAPIVIEDYTEFESVLARFRAEGITDLRVHLQARPELVRDIFKHKRVVAANRVALARTGYKSVEDMDRNLGDVMSEQAMLMFIEELAAIWRGEDRLTLEKIYHTKLGETIHTLINWEVGRKDGRRDLANVRLVFTEVTEQKKAEQALRQSEERYRLLFNQSPLAVVEFDYSGLRVWFEELRAKGVTDLAAYLEQHPEERMTVLTRAPLVEVNPATLRLLGARDKAELVARLKEVFTENAIRVRCANAVRIWSGILSAEGEIEVGRLDGQLRTLSYHWRMQEDEEGRPTFRRTQTVLVDITEKIVAERALRESEARYRELFEQAVGGIYRTSPEGYFLSVNPALAKILGFGRPEAMIIWSQTNTTPGLYVKPGRREEFITALNTRGQLNDYESEVHHHSGGTVWISENARAVRDAAGRLLYYEGFVTDISARRHLESEIGRASKLEAVGILAGGIAHDFNNILTVVLGNVTLAEADIDQGSPVGLRLQEAKRAVLRARDLTLQLLTFARGGEPVRTMIELPELLKESAGFALHGAKARGEFKFARGLWRVNADKGQLGQVVQNLVINAVQAMPEGGVITLSASNVVHPGTLTGVPSLPPGRYVHLAVADTGVGIAREHLAKIFDPYFTTKEQGSGLGLALVYSIVRKHDGHVAVESEPGKGAVFRIWLPAMSATASGPATGSTGSQSPFRVRVLFMDDEPSIRSMAVLFMERIGYDCDVAIDGAEAVRKYEEALAAGQKYEVVVMDLTVPGGMGGSEAMEQLRRLDPGICAIVSSGYSRDPVLANYQAHGFQAVLPKPYGLDQLTKVMRTVLDSPGVPT